MSLVVTVLAALTGCGASYVETPAEVDNDILAGDFESACVGLKMEDPVLREHTARALAEHPDEKIATDCVCVALYDGDAGKFDADAAGGLKKSKRGDLARCIEPALEDARVTDKAQVTKAISAIGGSDAKKILAEHLGASPDTAVRVGCAEALKGDEAYIPALADAASKDASAEVRVAAIAGLQGRKGRADLVAPLTAAAAERDVGVRGAALFTLGTLELAEADEVVCKAVMDDPDTTVRRMAALGWKEGRAASRSPVVACLKKRILTEEPSEEVRAAALAALGAPKSKEANAVLCDSIPAYVKMYVKDALPPDESPSDILFVQNDVDFERSYECVEKAVRAGGYSCYGKYYVAAWFTELGGKATARRCPGMPPPEGKNEVGTAVGATTEISFE
jgi:hypothetical protein